MTNPKKQLSVEKIGGTSIAATETVLSNVFLRPNADGGFYDRIFVLSAYAGFTNLLLEHKKTGEAGVYALFTGAESEGSWDDALSRVGDEMKRINGAIFDCDADRQAADRFIGERVEGVRS